MPASNAAAQASGSQQLSSLLTLWQQARESVSITPAGAVPGRPSLSEQINNLQTLWHSPSGGGSQVITPASAGPTPPATSDAATDDLINRLKPAQGGGNN